MKKIINILLFALILLFQRTLYGQIDTLIYFYSDFENAKEQGLWQEDGHGDWEFVVGGGTEGGKEEFPPTAATGTYNAKYDYVKGLDETSYNRLESIKSIDLSDAGKPLLSFYYYQTEDLQGRKGLVKLLFNVDGNWDTVWSSNYFSNLNLDDPPWTKVQINMDEQEDRKYLKKDFKIAFLAINKGTLGAGVDSVVIEEKDTIKKFVKELDYLGIDQGIITTKAEQEPLIKVRVNVFGNDGSSILKNISFRLNEGDASFFKSGGFRLYYTRDNTYNHHVSDTSTQIGGAVSVSDSTISFTGLNHKLNIGNNYLWLTADFADEEALHGSYFKIGVDAKSFRFNDSLCVQSDMDKVKDGVIEHAVLYDNFRSDLGWTLGRDFEIDNPLAKGNDPKYAFSGERVLGTDLTTDGKYEKNITSGYYAYSPILNLKYYSDVKVSMRMWSEFGADDDASMSFSNDGGATWNRIWYSVDDSNNDLFWEENFFDENVCAAMSRKEQVQFRFGIDSSKSEPGSGFNIDQFIIAGNRLDTDVGVTEIISPFDDCIGFHNDTVKAVFRNYAQVASPARIPVYYALWGKGGSRVVRDTIVGPIAKNDSIIFTFDSLAGFPKGDIYDNFVVGVELEKDEDPKNDSLMKLLYIQDTYTPITPVLTDFEYKGGVWVSDSKNWIVDTDNGSIPTKEDTYWTLYPQGNYARDEELHVTSACYDMTWNNRYMLQFKFFLQSEPDSDGFAVEYTTDDGKNWNLIENSGKGNNWGWYTKNVAALGHEGWSGDTVYEWVTVKELLPDLSTENKVKFRMKWAANDNDKNGFGVTFDDFEIFPAPADLGVSGIQKPDSACQFTNTDSIVEVKLKNYGFNDIKKGDTIVLGVDFMSDAPVIDTFVVENNIAPGASAIFKVPVEMDIDGPGEYTLKAYTINDGEYDFYGTMNDTINHSFTIWQNPISGMPDTLASRQPDTLMIKLNEDPTYSYLWFDGKTTSTHDVKKSQFYYSVTISESDHGCQTKDSTYVELLFNDIGADTVVTPISDCELTGNEYVTIRVKNKGTDSLIVGDQIHIYYSIDGGAVEHDSVTLTEPLMRGQTFDHIFNDPVDFSAERTYRIQASAYFGGDTIRTNDTIVNDIIVYGYPTVDLGPDSIVVEGLEHTLDPGEYSSYLWKPGGDTTRTLTVSESGTYTVQITDEHTCPAEDSIYVFLKITDVRPEIISPSTACDRSGDESVTLLIVNNGTGTIKTSDNITVSYLLDGGTKQEESVTIPKDIEPGGSMVHEFAKKEDIAEYRLYSIEVTATITGDMRPENDTVSKEFNTYKTPVVELGDSVQKVFGTEKVLEVEDDKDFTYAWTFNGNSFGSTNKVTATEGGVYKIVVSNDLSNGLCSARDSVDLAFDIDDFSLEEINLATNVCQSDTTTAVISVHNHSLEARENVKLMLGIQVGTGDAKVKEVTIEGIWAPTTTKDISFGETYNLESSLGTTNVRAYIDQDDARPENNEIVERVEVIEAAIVNFAGTVNDTLKVNEFPHLLDPGVPPAGNQFLWDDNVTVTPTFLAKTPGRYSVLVINQTGCRTFKEVWLEKASSMNQAARDNLTVVLKPNPAKDYLNIGATLKTGDEFIIEMFDISNRTVFSDKHSGIGTYNNELDVSNMSKGVYFIRVANKDIYFVNRVIIK